MNKPIKNDWKEQYIYPYLFQEESYRILGIKKKRSSESEFYKIKNKSTFLQIKRFISSLRYRNYFKEKSYCIQKSQKSSFKSKQYNNLIVQSLETIFLKEFLKEKSFFIEHKYNSIELSLISLEYQWISYEIILCKNQMYLCMHIEIIIRIMRKSIKDVSFIDYFRQHFYGISQNSSKENLIENIISSKWKTIRNIIWNIFSIEFQKFFLKEYTKNIIHKDAFDLRIRENISCFKKFKNFHILENTLRTKDLYLISKKQINLLYEKKTQPYQYIQTKNEWFLIFEKRNDKIEYFEKRYIKYLEKRFGYFDKRYKLELFQTKSFLLLGYKISIELINLKYNILNISNILEIYKKKRLLKALIPFQKILNVLALYGFCSPNGYPETKLGWTTWSDTLIVYKFKYIRNNILSYYSGAFNQKELLRIQHILHYSCAKTLACKHKTNLRRIWKKYGSNLSLFSPFHYKNISFDILGKKKNSDLKKNRRFWNLYFKEPNRLSIFVDKEIL